MPSLMRLAALSAVSVLALGAAGALAEEFHGFDPASHDASMISADQLAAMIEEAKGVTPPRNGESYVIGFANLQRDISFCIKVEEGLVANAEAAGVELAITDNRLDGATALANAESYVSRDVDYVIEFQTDANFGATIMQRMDEAGISVTAIDIPMPGSTFFGANNPRSGYMGGAYLAQAAIAEFGAEAAASGYFVVGELPQSGPIPAMRTGGQVAGFKAVLPDFPDDNLIFIDTKNTLQESFAQMNNVIGRIPDDAVIMITAINDQAATGMLRAVQQADREAQTLVVGMGADELDTMMSEPRFIASVGYFPERYGNYLLPMALMELAGKELPPAVLMNHVMISPSNVCEYYDTQECAEDAVAFDASFPEDAFKDHVAALREDPELAGNEDLIPSN
ncbi:MAG: sugar ABC transporter substrate-binding protein [Alphaproteobacteria bacterium]